MQTLNDENIELEDREPHEKECLREEVMLHHYFLKEAATPSPEQVEEELKRFHSRQGGGGRKFLTVGVSFLAGAAALFALLFWFYGNRFAEPAETPVTVFVAENAAADVTLQRVGGKPIVVGAGTNEVELKQLGAQLDAAGGQLSYTAASQEEEVQMQQLATPRQKMVTVTLSDGTEVWLNAESSLTYPNRFTGKERVVRLQGEAFFRVAKNADAPFIVQTENLSTKVLGTEFNVRNYTTDDVHVTLLEGSVEVRGASQGSPTRIRPGEDAHLTQEGGFDVRAVDTDSYCLWREGLFYFDNVPLLDIAKAIGRWYNVDVVFNNRRAMDVTIHFLSERTGTLQQTVDLLNSLHKATLSIVNGQLVVD